MADDIDIEEHDIRDDPRIKDILPHCYIKEEPIEHYEDSTDDNQLCEQYEEPDCEPYVEFSQMSGLSYAAAITGSVDRYHNNKIILGSKKPSCPPITITSVSSDNDLSSICNKNATVTADGVVATGPIYDGLGSQEFDVGDDVGPSTSGGPKVVNAVSIKSKPGSNSKKATIADAEMDIKDGSNFIKVKPGPKSYKQRKIESLLKRKASQNTVNKSVVSAAESSQSITETSESITKTRPQNKNVARLSQQPVACRKLLSRSKETLNSQPISTQQPKTDLGHALVVLEDRRDSLNGFQCYCDRCHKLFPTRNALDDHNSTAHSFLVALEDSIPASPEKELSASEDVDVVDNSADGKKHCNQCPKYFDDDLSLIEHIYEHVPGNKREKQFYKCPVCYSFYVSGLRFLKHAAKSHSLAVKLNSVKKVPFQNVCNICNKGTTILSHNKHILKIHKSYFFKKVNNNKTQVGKVANSKIRKNVDVKTAIKYNGAVKKLSFRKALPDLIERVHSKNSSVTIKTKRHLEANFKCVKCKTFYATKKYAMTHVRMKHSDDIVKFKTVDGSKTVLQGSKTGTKTFDAKKTLGVSKTSNVTKDFSPYRYYGSYIPVNATFQCNRCSANILCPTAMEFHSNSPCKRFHSSKTAYWTCKICNKLFRYRYKRSHEMQHEKCDDIKTYPFLENLYHRLLCKCSGCNVYFLERKFLKHQHEGCIDEPTEWCGVCKIIVDSSINHEFAHEKLSRSDFVFLDKFFKEPMKKNSKSMGERLKLKATSSEAVAQVPSGLNTNSLKRTLPLPATTSKMPKKNRVDLYYCPYCHTFSKNVKCSKFHAEKYCQNRQGAVCPCCGLVFRAGTPLMRHKDEHKRLKWKFEDYVFYNVIDGKPIVPQIPVYPACRDCNVQHITQQHQCNDKKKYCSLCNKQFSLFAYKLHRIHHKYLKPADIGVSELLQMYESLNTTWNRIYQCSHCRVATDSYDGAVDHAQRHIASIPNKQALSLCEICRIYFDDISGKKHKELHSNGDINRSSFNILTFKYQDLLGPNWFQLFRNISKPEVEKITSPSMYVTRSVKMNLILSGPPERTIYKCQTCKNFVDPFDVLNHTNVCNGDEIIPSYRCRVCDIPFNSANAVSKHMENHKTGTKTDSYRVIAFNAETDKQFNRKLLHYDSVEPEHVDNKDKISFCIFLKCVLCNMCSSYADFYKQHNCSELSKVELWTCHKCSFTTLGRFKSTHIQFHETNGHLRRKDIYFFPFDKTVDETCKTHLRFQCDECEAFLSASHLKHACESSPAITCTICGYKFTRKSYVHHIQNHEKNLMTKDNTHIVPLARPKYSGENGVHYNFSESDGPTRESREVGERESRGLVKCKKCRLPVRADMLQKHSCKRKIYSSTSVPVAKRHLPIVKRKLPIVKRKKSEVIYRCSRCLCLFLNVEDVSKHRLLNNCDSAQAVECGICDLKFHQGSVSAHRKSHLNKFDKAKFRILTIDDATRHTLFKCNMCSVHMLSRVSFDLHLTRCRKKGLTANCEICGLLLHLNSVNKHVTLHHSGTQKASGANDFDIVCGDPISPISKLEAGKSAIDVVYEPQPKPTKKKMMVATFPGFEFDRTLYYCWCGVFLTSKKGLMTHANNHGESKEQCQICDLVFTSECLPMHKLAHHETMRLEIEDFVLSDSDGVDKITFKCRSNATSQRTDKNCVFQCEKCSLHFLHMHDVINHCSSCSGDGKADEAVCDVCGLNFTKNSLITHNIVHHEVLKFTTDDLHVLVVAKYDGDSDLNLINESFSLDETFETANEDPLRLNETASLPMEAETFEDTENEVIYRCGQCDLHFLSEVSGERHVHMHFNLDYFRQKQKAGDVAETCGACQLRFPVEVMNKHVMLHHEKVQRKLIIRDLDIPDIKKQKPRDRLYKCVKCDINFFGSSTLLYHKSDSRGVCKTPWVECSICGLKFTHRGLKKHTERHHADRSVLESDEGTASAFDTSDGQMTDVSVTADVSVVDRPDAEHASVDECTEASVSLDVNTLTETSMEMDTESTADIGDTNDNAMTDLNRADASNSTLLNRSELDESNDNSTNKSELDEMNEDVGTRVMKHKENIRLYKCGECNVFFLSQATCYKHIIYHKVMKSEEYIECKFCTLPFKIMSLVKHISRHHKTEFHLSDVLVEEYWPKKACEKAPKIEIYYAIDKVQSRLVSTTTDDNKVESSQAKDDKLDASHATDDKLDASRATDDTVDASHTAEDTVDESHTLDGKEEAIHVEKTLEASSSSIKPSEVFTEAMINEKNNVELRNNDKLTDAVLVDLTID